MEPDTNWFRAPDNHFWYWTLAPEYPPPFTSNDVWEGMPANAPVPTNRGEMSRFIRVVIGLLDGNMYWQGDFLSDFPLFMNLDENDLSAWKEWVNSDPVQNFIDETIVKCQMQAEINKDASGVAVIKNADGDSDLTHEVYKEIINPLIKRH